MWPVTDDPWTHESWFSCLFLSPNANDLKLSSSLLTPVPGRSPGLGLDSGTGIQKPPSHCRQLPVHLISTYFPSLIHLEVCRYAPPASGMPASQTAYSPQPIGESSMRTSAVLCRLGFYLTPVFRGSWWDNIPRKTRFRRFSRTPLNENGWNWLLSKTER